MNADFLNPGPIPVVNSNDLRKMWDYIGRMQDTRTVGTDVSVFKSICSPGADVFAVWQRAAMLQLVERLELLSRWIAEGRLDDTLIEIAADFPMDWMEGGVIYNALPFDVQKFLERVDAHSGKAGG
jgi:hypothetical protein